MDARPMRDLAAFVVVVAVVWGAGWLLWAAARRR